MGKEKRGNSIGFSESHLGPKSSSEINSGPFGTEEKKESTPDKEVGTKGSSHPPYFPVFVILAVLTVVEIYASGLDVPQADIIALLMLFATAKAMLVALYYMHLKYESYALRMIAFIPLVIAVMFALMLLV